MKQPDTHRHVLRNRYRPVARPWHRDGLAAEDSRMGEKLSLARICSQVFSWSGPESRTRPGTLDPAVCQPPGKSAGRRAGAGKRSASP